MYPSINEELRRQQVDQLWRLAEESRQSAKALGPRSSGRIRSALGTRLLRAGRRVGGQNALCSAGLREA